MRACPRFALASLLALSACADGGVMDAGPGDSAPTPDAGPPRLDAGRDAGSACGPELCNGADDDCDGEVDEDAADAIDFYRDFDEDGVGTALSIEKACEAPEGYVAVGGDCNDGNDLISPALEETCDGLDDDCSGVEDDGVSCPLGCTPVPFGGHGYLFCAGAGTWEQARVACGAVGLSLVRVDTPSEREFLWETASRPGGIGEYWVGGRLADDGADTWTWVDGTAYWQGQFRGDAVDGLYGAWESDQPSHRDPPSCVRARAREAGHHHDVSCAASLSGYVCERS